jgi:predicted metalloprotease with PDZ domain
MMSQTCNPGAVSIFSFALALAVGAVSPSHAQAQSAVAPKPAEYLVRMLPGAVPKLAVTASLPIHGQALAMETTRPADIPELDAQGWPALVKNLRVSDERGRPVGVTPADKSGWRLDRELAGRLVVRYEVDYSALAARGWPAPRESAFADADNLVIVGRSLFITTPEVGASQVKFSLPQSWRAVTPWERRPVVADSFAARSAQDLVENLVVLTRSAPEEVTAGRFRLLVASMGHWQPVRPEVRETLGALVQRFVRLMEFKESESYLVVLLPVVDSGGEAFRRSFALTVDTPPSRANRALWGNTIGHEIFHFWNGWRLRGADYATSQWFQEGFTEYVANVSMAEAGLIGPDDLRRKLAEHVRNSRRLTTSLEGGGTHKGPPLYSGGALVAFSWDVLIRDASHGKRDLGDFLRALWRRTEGGQRTYEWHDIQVALNAASAQDWDAFHRAYIQGTEPLPLNEILLLAGLRLAEAEDGSPLVEPDPAAQDPARSLWRALATGRPAGAVSVP